MKPTNSIIAIIPARKGSKRIPNKNIKFFFGKPIIAHTIINLKKTKIFDQIIVSTDSKKIANIAKKYGAKVPFLRPLNLAGDKAGTTEVIAHAVSWLTNNGYRIKNVCCIYPTSVLIQKDDLKLGLKFLKLKKWDYIFSAAAYEHPIFRSFKQNSKKKKLNYFFLKK